MAEIRTVGVIGAGQMGTGIAHVCALAGYDVLLNDLSAERIEAGIRGTRANMTRQVARGIISQDAMDAGLARIVPADDMADFKTADLIVASPPCQEYSYMAMPWSRAKAIAADYRSGKRDVADLTRLFDACFRIQREACEAAGHHIPLVVENVRGANRWVGRSRRRKSVV